MLHRPKRKTVLITAAAVSVGLAGIVAIPFGANATLSGLDGALAATNGTKHIYLDTGTTLSTTDTIAEGSWAPDASRMVYVNADNDLRTVRYNDGANAVTLVDHASPSIPAAGGIKSHPVYSPDGGLVYYSQQDYAGQPGILWVVSPGYNPGQLIDDDTATYTHPDTSEDGNFVGTLLFQKQAWTWTDPSDHTLGGSVTGLPEIWGWTSDAQVDPALIVSNAASPAVYGGTRLAFVRSVSGNRQIFAMDLDGSNLVQLTTDAVDHDNPTWSPDGTKIAFNEGLAVDEMDANGANAAVVSGLTGLPAYATGQTNWSIRVSGPNRFATAIATSRFWDDAATHSNPGLEAQAVVLSRSDTFADALGGAALAAAKQGPLLLTDPKSLTPDTATEISRVLGTDTTKTVYLLGSTGAISQAVETQVRAMGYQVKRLGGSDRFATSIKIADEINPHPSLILAATGMDFPDALGAGAAAGSFDAPGSGSPLSAVVVLTNNGTLPASTKTYLDAQEAYADANSLDAPIFGIGKQGYQAIGGYSNTWPVFGDDRFGTSHAVAQVFFGGEVFAGVATGLNWPDALAGGALMGTLNAPMLLAGKNGIESNVAKVFDENSPSIVTAFIFGSAGVVSDATLKQVAVQISGPAPYVVQTTPNASVGRTLARTTDGHPAGSGPTAAGHQHPTLTQITAAAGALARR